MAKHKSATEVTVASMTETGALQQLVSKYWVPACVGIAAIVGLVLFLKHQAESAVQDRIAAWDPYAELVTSNLQDGFPEGDSDALSAAAQDSSRPIVAGFLRATEALNRRREGDWDGTRAAAASISADVELFHEPFDGGPPLATRIEQSGSAAAKWEAEHTDYFANPALPSDAPKVRIVTTSGELVVGLYTQRSPQLCENFLKLCGEGFYDNTKLHRVEASSVLHGGDPNSKEGAPETWGQGGPDYTVSAKPNQLLHFEGALAAWKKPGDTESSGSQFMISTSDTHDRNGNYVIFGQVIEGIEAAKTMAAAPLSEGTENPLEPIEVISTTVL